MSSSTLVIAPPPVCPLGHGPMSHIPAAPTAAPAEQEEEHFRCPQCSCQISRPLPFNSL